MGVFVLISTFQCISRDTSYKNQLEGSVSCVKFSAESDFEFFLWKKFYPTELRAYLWVKMPKNSKKSTFTACPGLKKSEKICEGAFLHDFSCEKKIFYVP